MQYRCILADGSVNLRLCNMFVRHLELLKERNVEERKILQPNGWGIHRELGWERGREEKIKYPLSQSTPMLNPIWRLLNEM